MVHTPTRAGYSGDSPRGDPGSQKTFHPARQQGPRQGRTSLGAHFLVNSSIPFLLQTFSGCCFYFVQVISRKQGLQKLWAKSQSLPPTEALASGQIWNQGLPKQKLCHLYKPGFIHSSFLFRSYQGLQKLRVQIIKETEVKGSSGLRIRSRIQRSR